jgi:hypothetical protein
MSRAGKHHMADIRVLVGLGAIAAGFTVLPAQAVPVTLCGTSICYEYDNDALVNPGISLYGAPTILSGNTIKFVPSNFNADSDTAVRFPPPPALRCFNSAASTPPTVARSRR